MKVQIKHINNTFNYGSCMMAITLINKLKENFENIEIYADASNDVNLRRLKRETGFENIFRDNIGAGNNIFERILNKLKRLKLNKIVNGIENVIIIGGDDISEYYGVEALEYRLSCLKEDSKSKKIILLGQTIGPFSSEREDLVRECLENTKIYTRDDNCLKYLEELDFKNVERGRDLAFLKLPMQNKVKSVLNRYNLESNEYITIVPSGLTKCYTEDLESYICEQVNIIKFMINNDNIIDKKIVLLPHVILPQKVDDRNVIKEIVRRLDEHIKNRIVAIGDELLPSEAREILGNGLLTITGRMHAAVSTFYMRKPAISLSYSVKYAGVIGDGLDMNELVIESADDKLWKSGEISTLVDEKVQFVLDNYDELIKKMDRKVTETSKITEEQLDDLVNQIKK